MIDIMVGFKNVPLTLSFVAGLEGGVEETCQAHPMAAINGILSSPGEGILRI